MAIKGAIFDMDGTVLDSMHIWIKITEEYLKKCTEDESGKIALEEISKNAKDIGGLTLRDLAILLIKKNNLSKTPDDIITDMNMEALEGYRKTATVKPGTVEFLEELKSRNVKICMATASDRFLVEEILESHDVLKYFDKIFTCRECGANKSSPKIFEDALDFLGTDKESTYIFEDTYTPIFTATHAGFKTIAIADKWSLPKRELIKKEAYMYVDSISDLDIDKL